jgi:hypothetical protein
MNERKERKARIIPTIPNCAKPIPKKKRTVSITPLIDAMALPSHKTDSLGPKVRATPDRPIESDW